MHMYTPTNAWAITVATTMHTVLHIAQFYVFIGMHCTLLITLVLPRRLQELVGDVASQDILTLVLAMKRSEKVEVAEQSSFLSLVKPHDANITRLPGSELYSSLNTRSKAKKELGLLHSGCINILPCRAYVHSSY